MSSTNDRILDAARELFDARHDAPPSMSAIARAVGISRQALYLHFPDRGALLMALVAHVDEREDLQAGLAEVDAAPDAVAQVRAFTQMQAWRNPRIGPLARALDHARHTDEQTAAAWRDRTAGRMRGARAIAERLRGEGLVHESWKADEAAALLWELTSFRVWDDLVNETGLSPKRYVEVVVASACSALAAPVGR